MEQQARALESAQPDQAASPSAARRVSARLHLKPDGSSKPPLHLPRQRSNRRKEQGSLQLLTEY